MRAPISEQRRRGRFYFAPRNGTLIYEADGTTRDDQVRQVLWGLRQVQGGHAHGTMKSAGEIVAQLEERGGTDRARVMDRGAL